MPTFIPLRHLFPLIIAVGNSLGGFIPIFSPRRGILAYGLPSRIAHNPEAQLIFPVYGSRATIIGTAMLICYLRDELQTFDLLLGLLSYGAAVDAWTTWQEGLPGKAVFRGVMAAVLGLWGWFDVTAGGT